MKKEDYIEFEKMMKNRPHLVILGAGASVATILNGDANGRQISVMDGFIDKLNMKNLIEEVEINTDSDNLEDIYSELYERDDCKEVLETLESRIYDYLLQFEIPSEPTIYDYLILSLRKKDVIATFNWDPLLLQAYKRVSRITNELPELLFLHGNVYVGVCHEHKRGGFIGNRCPICGDLFEKTKLLFPVKNKDYDSDLLIKDHWNAIRYYMEKAFVVTIFGYSAPKTDKVAIDLLKNSWGEKEKRNFEEIEIIDIKDEKELVETWNDFIHTHHYQVCNSFFDSIIAQFPRRSCEAIFDRFFNLKWLDGRKGLKNDMNFEDLNDYFDKILHDERIDQKILTTFGIVDD